MNNSTTDPTNQAKSTETETPADELQPYSPAKVKHLLLTLLESRKGDIVHGFDKYNHSVLSAAIANDTLPESEEHNRAAWVTAALFHDVFGEILPGSHAHAIAEALEPFVPHTIYVTLFGHDRMMLAHWFPEDTYSWQVRAEMAKSDRFRHKLWFADEVDAKAFEWGPYDPAGMDHRQFSAYYNAVLPS